MPTLIGLVATSGSGVVTPPIHSTATLSLSGWAGKLYCIGGMRAVVTAHIGAHAFYSYGHSGGTANGVQAILSGYSFTSRIGGQARVVLSTYAIAASGTVTVPMTAQLVLSHCTLNAHGVVDEVGRVQVTLKNDYTLTIRGGAQIVGRLSGYSLNASGTVDKLARVVVALHRCTLVAHAYQDGLAEIRVTAPAMRPAPSGIVVVKLSRATLSSFGTTGSSAEYEAYSITFIDGGEEENVATTHYTSYPFDRFVRFNNINFGVGADGLFELTGDTFNGTPIISYVETANTDFEKPELKRPISLYIAGRVGADFRVTVNSAEVQDNRYLYRPVDKTGARNYRVMFGKGIRARYLSYAFTNINGGDFVLDDIAPEFVVTRRTA